MHTFLCFCAEEAILASKSGHSPNRVAAQKNESDRDSISNFYQERERDFDGLLPTVCVERTTTAQGQHNALSAKYVNKTHVVNLVVYMLKK